MTMAPLPSLHGHYTRFITTTKQSALPGASVLSASRWEPLAPFSLGIAEQVLTFRTRAWLSFAPPTCRCRLGRLGTSPKLIPEEGSPPAFDIV